MSRRASGSLATSAASSCMACFQAHEEDARRLMCVSRSSATPYRLTPQDITKLRGQGFLIQVSAQPNPYRTLAELSSEDRAGIVADRRGGMQAKEVALKWNTTLWAVNDVMAKWTKRIAAQATGTCPHNGL